MIVSYVNVVGQSELPFLDLIEQLSCNKLVAKKYFANTVLEA